MNYYVEVLDIQDYEKRAGYSILRIGSEVDDEYSPILSFFASLSFRDYAEFLDNTTKGWGAYRNEMHFLYGPFNEEGLILEDGEVFIKTVIDTEITSIATFEEIALDLAHKALEAVTWFNLKELGHVDQQWIDDIKNWIRIKE
jgi:hypothetical protein